MFKLFLPLFLATCSVTANDKVEIYAASMDSQENIVKAIGGVSVIYGDYYLTAEEATYNRESGELELFDNIRVNKGGAYKILGKHAKLNIKKKEKLFKPFYMSEINSKVWMSGGKGTALNEDIDISSGSLSGCDPINPLWKIEFSSSSYNSDSKWMNLYNAIVYIEDVAVFYMPYFGYSLDTTRRSGLLMPLAGYSGEEGFFYEQPIYIAEQNWWDLTLKPQVRTQRGQGIYQTFRFVDSKTSNGELKAGYFDEFNEYFVDSNLQNNTHYGFSFKYDNSDFINQWFGTKLEGQAGLYTDINHMNDVDYINLSSNDAQNNSTATQVLSRVNAFYNIENHYVGAYFKYYQDLTLASNADTLQKLPTLQYHYYLDTLMKDHILYTLDIQANNIEREINKKLQQTDVSIPLTFQTPFFDEYLNISYKANLYAQYSAFTGEEEVPTVNNVYEDGYLLRNYHTVSISSQLTRGYEDFSHVVGFSLSYNKDGEQFKNGYYENSAEYCSDELNANEKICEFYNISTIQDQTQLDFTQYIYNESAEQILYHRLAQTISYAENKDRLGELENELDYRITNYLHFYNDMFFNYDKGLFSKLFNRVSFNNNGIDLIFSHLYKDNFIDNIDENERYTSYMTSSLRYTYNRHYSYSGKYNYDLQNQETKSMEIGFLYKKRCWDFGLKYSENNRPILTTSGESSIYDKYIYLTVALKPLMQSNDTSFLMYQLPNEN